MAKLTLKNSDIELYIRRNGKAHISLVAGRAHYKSYFWQKGCQLKDLPKGSQDD